MTQHLHPIEVSSPKVARSMCIFLGLLLIAAGFLVAPPDQIFKGLANYMHSSSVLTTDYFVIGSIGAAFVNAGLVTLISVALTVAIGTPYTGSTIAMIYLMAGFALFGKTPINILPFFLGVWGYSKYKGLPMKRYTNAALFSTSLAPIVSLIYLRGPFNGISNLLLAIFVGATIGYIIIPLAEHSFSTHMGYSLFNFGFAGGLLALLIASVVNGLGGSIATVLFWNEGVPTEVLTLLLVLIAGHIIAGLYICRWRIQFFWRILRHSGQAPTDFVITDGIGATMVNMGAMGIVSLGYILLIGGDLNGPVLGAILTSIGFGAAGEHPKNSIPVMFGVFIASFLMTPAIDAPVIQLAALFGTALAPISGEFGWKYGIIAGFLHTAMVLAVGAPCGGFNLYNNGFAAGLVALIMVSLIQGISRHFGRQDRH